MLTGRRNRYRRYYARSENRLAYVGDPATAQAFRRSRSASSCLFADAGHAFAYDGLQERIETARQRVEALMDRLLGRAR